MYNMTVFNAVQCKRGPGGGGSGGCGEGLEIARLKVFITVGLVLDVSSYHMKILDSACGMLAQ